MRSRTYAQIIQSEVQRALPLFVGYWCAVLIHWFYDVVYIILREYFFDTWVFQLWKAKFPPFELVLGPIVLITAIWCIYHWLRVSERVTLLDDEKP